MAREPYTLDFPTLRGKIYALAHNNAQSVGQFP